MKMRGERLYIFKRKLYSHNFGAKIFVAIIFILGGLFPFQANAQDANFSQYYAAPLYLNPALAGFDTRTSIGLNYRSQQKTAPFPNEMNQFSFIKPIMGKGDEINHKGGIGVSAFREIAGQNANFSVVGVSLAAAYNLYLDAAGKQKLTFAVQGSYIMKKIDFSNLTWGSQHDPFLGFDQSITPEAIGSLNDNANFMAINAGFMWYIGLGDADDTYHSNAYLGFAVNNLNKPDESLIDGKAVAVPQLYKLNAGIDLGISEKLTISPNVVVKYQDEILQFNAGSYLYYSLKNPDLEEVEGSNTSLILGTWYRYGDSFVFSAGISKGNMTIGASYDLRTTTLRHPDIGSGTYEISIHYRFKRKGAKPPSYEHKPRFEL